ncbi:DNA/RNA non-specific endonuclease [Leeuwenhoekiella aestuarii]|uniref:Endonuclease n=1 Tax=Leeuwenhoekiella aestuarii TaxID=2249426 RepID=A0A4Q0NQM5_9FLAO|nr:DNA/RNA non-specific endonuclease [Leeuwenhoekiella aestuarii]RXG12708.1 endonuclease G [Leeuwenhoekiella aestuarii]
MKRKYTYPLLMMVVITLIVLGEKYIENQEKNELVKTGEVVKSQELSFFLPKAESNTLVHHQYYTLSYNEAAEQAAWVAYMLTRDQLKSVEVSRPYFDIDAAVGTGAADWRNYKNSGYDRGHLCPAGDRSFSSQAYNETFLTSNISPQLHEFNGGVWNRLENKIRDWARKYDKVTIITGGVLADPLATIGHENVIVPRAFYKIVLRETASGYTCLAFLIPHSESDRDLKAFVVSVDSLEAVTGIDFFPKLVDSEENRIEKEKLLKDWKF